MSKYKFILFCIIVATSATPAFANEAIAPVCNMDWVLIPANSKLSFKGKQMAEEFLGEFKKFNAEICFDPDHIENSHVSVNIDVSSLDTGNADRDSSVNDESWFHIKKFPEATFNANKFEKTGEKSYLARGDLKIKDIAIPITLPFTLDITKLPTGENQTAIMHGQIMLDRSNFALGTGDWSDPSIIANDVAVTIKVTAVHHFMK